MMDILLNTHSVNRFVLLAIAIICIARLISNVMRAKNFSRSDAQWLRWFATFMAIQFALGLVLFVKDGINLSWNMHEMRAHMEHAVTMILALGLSHATASARRKDPSTASKRALIFMAASLLFVVAGVARLKGISFWLGN